MTTDLEKEREAFEAWAKQHYGYREFSLEPFLPISDHWRGSWAAWQARAALAAPAAPQPTGKQDLQVAAPQEQPSDEDDLTQALKERDDAEDMADQLAAQIAAITGEEIGEHSSANDPWRNAMLAADEFIAVQIRKLCSAPARQTAPQEQPSDEEIRDIWSQQEGFHPDPVAFALLSRYGAAPQGGEDAHHHGSPDSDQNTDQSVMPEYLAWLRDHARIEGVGGNEAWNAGVAWARSQPAGRDAREASDES